MRPPLVSSACLEHFSEETERRKKVRSRRQRVEKQQAKRAEAAERKSMGKCELAVTTNPIFIGPSD